MFSFKDVYFNIDIHCIYNNFNIDIHCIYYNCGSVLKGVWHEICLLLQGSPALPSWKSNGRSKQNAFTAKEIRIICTVNFYPKKFSISFYLICLSHMTSISFEFIWRLASFKRQRIQLTFYAYLHTRAKKLKPWVVLL